MSLRFHWFLPTNGDARDIAGTVAVPVMTGELKPRLAPAA